MTPDVGHSPLDLDTFERLYHATAARVHSLARRLLGHERAEAATQDVYLRAWLKRASYRGEAAASTWLHRLARNELVNQVRGMVRREDETQLDEDSTHAGDGRDRLRSSDLRLDLERALHQLPTGARLVFVLHDVEGLQHGEIAEGLGVSLGTSKSQLHRARALLRAALISWSEVEDE